MKANCKHCSKEFNQRRDNHVYCKPGCKTMASYKRNGYKYISGRYQKAPIVEPIEESITLTDNKIEKMFKALTKEIKQLSRSKETGMTDSIKGTLLADTINYGARKVFAPLTLPATREDIDKIEKQLELLQLQYANTQILNTKLLKHLDLIEFKKSFI